MTELRLKNVVAQIEGIVCDITLSGIYTCSVINKGGGRLSILFADGRTLQDISDEKCAEVLCAEFKGPKSFAIQVVAQLTGRKLCDCGEGFAQEPHICPYTAEIGDDLDARCTCCRECEQNCYYDI